MNKAILCLVSVVCFAVPAVGCGGGAFRCVTMNKEDVQGQMTAF